MPARIRLQRFGKKGMPYYHIVIADGRAPRDGRFIEKIGTYNPLTSPATIEINYEKALEWLHNGASPTDTVRAILSFKGVMYKFHLSIGVKKGALTPELAEAKFQTWLQEKEAKIESKKKQKELDKKSKVKADLAAEVKVNETRASLIAEKQSKLLQKEQESKKTASEEAVAAEEVATAEEVAAPEAIVATEEPKAAENSTPETEA